MRGRPARLPRRAPGRRAGDGRGRGRFLAGLVLAGLLCAIPLLGSPVAAAAQDSGEEQTELGGGVYLYRFQPLDLEEVPAVTEIYALYLDLDRTEGPFRFHVQGRWRDTKLREFYPSNAWVQEAWAQYTWRPAGEGSGASPGGDAAAEEEAAGDRPRLQVRAGKIYQRLGRFWDGSFLGNIHYFDGLKLDPDFGVLARGRAPVGPGRLDLRGQYLLNGDRVNGALGGRDLEGIDGAEERDSFLGGVRYRVPLWSGGPTAVAGASGLLERGETADGSPFRLGHVALEGALRLDGYRLYAEWTDRSAGRMPGAARRTVAGSPAEYWLAGARATFGRLHLRYNYSRGEYGGAGFVERIHQPGVTVDVAPGLHVLVEYDGWVRRPEDEDAGRGPGGREAGELRARLDRSLNVVVLAEF